MQTQTRQMCVKIVNNRTGSESWEKIYISSEIKTPLLSKYCIVRLKVINPAEFLNDDEVQAMSVNTVEEKKSKLSECKKSFFTKKWGEPMQMPRTRGPPGLQRKITLQRV